MEFGVGIEIKVIFNIVHIAVTKSAIGGWRAFNSKHYLAITDANMPWPIDREIA